MCAAAAGHSVKYIIFCAGGRYYILILLGNLSLILSLNHFAYRATLANLILFFNPETYPMKAIKTILTVLLCSLLTGKLHAQFSSTSPTYGFAIIENNALNTYYVSTVFKMNGEDCDTEKVWAWAKFDTLIPYTTHKDASGNLQPDPNDIKGGTRGFSEVNSGIICLCNPKTGYNTINVKGTGVSFDISRLNHSSMDDVSNLRDLLIVGIGNAGKYKVVTINFPAMEGDKPRHKAHINSK
jgi:hypothetical protein